jgi:hypothetical protein
MTAVLTDPGCGGEDAGAALSEVGEPGYKGRRYHRITGARLKIVHRWIDFV